VRGVSKALPAVFLTLLLAIGLAACGGGDDSESTTETSGQQQSQVVDSASQDDDKGSGEGSESGDDSTGDNGQSGGDASDFVPKKHDDSGGGAEQLKVKGGDNSVQEFGEEADSEEFAAAAAALHNFLDARAEGNWAAACRYMASSVIESFEKLTARAKGLEDTSCSGVLEKLINPAAAQSMEEEAAKADVRSLRIEGERAFVIYTGIDATVLAMPMANEDGDWKVSSLSGVPLS
jgi:hypothetical protein